MSIHFDVSNFPIVCLTYGASFSDDDVAGVNVRLLGLLAKNQPFILLSDMTLGIPSASQAQTSSDFVNKHRDLFRKLVKGNAIAIASTPARAMIRAMLLIVKPPFPVGIAATRNEAEKWCSQQLMQKSA